MAVDTRYARCAGIGEAYLSMIKDAALRALDNLDSEKLRTGHDSLILRINLNTILKDSTAALRQMDIINKEPNPELSHGEGTTYCTELPEHKH